MVEEQVLFAVRWRVQMDGWGLNCLAYARRFMLIVNRKTLLRSLGTDELIPMAIFKKMYSILY